MQSSIVLSAFSRHEQLYMKFMLNSVTNDVDKKLPLVFIQANADKQADFEKLVRNEYCHLPINDVHFSIRKALNNIWSVIKKDLEEVLDESELSIEKNNQSYAYKEQMKHGLNGKVFTLKQARIFTLYAKSVTIQSLKPLNDCEKIYLKSVSDEISKSLSKKYSGIFLGVTKDMQIGLLLAAKCNGISYSKDNLNLCKIVHSLANRAVIHSTDTLDLSETNDEAEKQQIANTAILDYIKKGIQGRMLTERQAQALLEYIQ